MTRAILPLMRTFALIRMHPPSNMIFQRTNFLGFLDYLRCITNNDKFDLILKILNIKKHYIVSAKIYFTSLNIMYSKERYIIK